MNKVALTLSAVCSLFFANQDYGQWAPTGGPEGGHVYALAVNGSAIYAGTGGSGVWRRPLSEMIANTSVLPLNHQKRSLQNRIIISASGNLRSGVVLNYSIVSHGFVRLGVYSISGKQVALCNGEQAPGEYSVTLERGTIPAGLYVYHFQAGNFQESNLVRIME